jgi:hypothetical protein
VTLGKKGAAGKHVYRAEWFGLNASVIDEDDDWQEYARTYL